MLASRKWLNRLVEIEDISSQELAQLLTDAGHEVEGVFPLAQGTHLEIGQILTCEKHPDADSLSVTKVQLGHEQVQIVCGAPNVAVGQKVIVAKVGAQLPELQIKEAKIRNVLSQGMICSLPELGVASHLLEEADKEGIHVLDESAPIGDDPLVYLGLDDEVLDIDLTPNRSDLLSMQSLAYEIAAITGREINIQPTLNDPVVDASSFVLDSTTKNCTQFLAKVVNQVVVKESPTWIKQALRGCGMNPINNVVDISNLVMLETGQPSHFYDKRYFGDHLEITVRDDFEGEVVGLDGETYDLVKGDTVITSQNKPIGIAGIKGLGNSMIVDDTSSIVIELASFLPVPIRTTAQRLNLHSESSIRYSKAMDPLAPQKAMERILFLLTQYAQMDQEEQTVTYPKTLPVVQQKTIETSLEKINSLLGAQYTQAEVVEVFQSLRLQPVVNQQKMTCTIPTDRLDLVIAEDLIEEVIRLKGFESIPSTLPTLPNTRGQLNHEQIVRRKVADVLVASGASEVITYTLVSEEINDHPLALQPPVRLLNPLSEKRKVIRGGLTHSLLGMLHYNLNMKNDQGLYFEVSKVYQQGGSQWRLGLIGVHQLGSIQLNDVNLSSNYWLIKGVVEKVLNAVGINSRRLRYETNDIDVVNFHPYRSAKVYLDQDFLGLIGEIHPQDVPKGVLAELNLSLVIDAKKAKTNYQPLSRYPKVTRDIAIVVNPSISHDLIVQTIQKAGTRLLKDIVLFDRFPLQDLTSLAYRLTFESSNHTLSEKDINTVMDAILAALEKHLGASLRSS